MTVGCDGRWSVVRTLAGLRAREFPVPVDTWWFRLPREGDERATLVPGMRDGHFAVVIPREGYFQIAYLARKGLDAQLRAEGLDAFRARIAEVLPEFADRVGKLESMDDVKHLDVRLNLLRRWHRAGVLCIGDAAHAMSPIGGVGINLAVQDAVATARLLARSLLRAQGSGGSGGAGGSDGVAGSGGMGGYARVASRRRLRGRGRVTQRELARVHRRRWLPTIIVQAIQRAMHRGVIRPVIEGHRNGPPQVIVRVLGLVPAARKVPAYLIGVGLFPEHAPDFARRK